MIRNLSQQNSLISEFIGELRDPQIQQDRLRFRKNMERLGTIFAYEISKELNYQKKKIVTTLGEADCFCLNEQPVLGTILRAGVPFYQGMLNYLDRADSAFISSHRAYNADHSSFEIKLESLSCPDLTGRTLIICDPMLATGASLAGCIKEIYLLGKPKKIHVAAIIASPEGIARMRQEFPECTLWLGAIDQGLNPQSYIVPGLGDAGDLAFGCKVQN